MGSITGSDNVGGLIGFNEGTVADSYASAAVSGKEYIGGLVGYNTAAINRCYCSSVVNAIPDYFPYFDGYDDYITIPDNNISDYDVNAFTIEAWVKWDDWQTNNVGFIFGKTVEQFEIHTGGGSGIGGIRFIPDVPNGLEADTYIDTDQHVLGSGWCHVAATYDSNTDESKVYINGQEQNLNIKGISQGNSYYVPERLFSDHGSDIFIGRRSDNTFYFKGMIRDVRLWNYARDGLQIAANMDKEISAAEGLIGYWKLKNIAGNTATDSSLTNNPGTLSGDISQVAIETDYQGGLIGYSSAPVNNS
jgi:hypothetical protein